MSEPVSVIILNYNGRRFLGECIKSVLNQTYVDFELILFDNASTDNSIGFVKDNFGDERIKILRSETNLGFAGGNNEALKHCSSDIIVLLNNDTIVDKNWLKYLVDSISERNTVASSFVITQGIPEKYYKTNGSVSYLMYNVMNVFDNSEIFYPNGCSVIFRKSEVGYPFDESYYYYGEDVYLGLMARFRGMKVVFARDSVVNHIGSGTNSDAVKKTFYQERNRFLNIYLFFSPWYIIKILPYIFFNHSFNIILSLLGKGKPLMGLLKAYIWFYLNIPLVLKKRKQVRNRITADESEVIKYMTSKVFNGENLFERITNKLSYFYSRFVGLKSHEYYNKS
jgi:GT2 family glycosyltransferase